jgi:hypothetical protein
MPDGTGLEAKATVAANEGKPATTPAVVAAVPKVAAEPPSSSAEPTDAPGPRRREKLPANLFQGSDVQKT